MSLDYQILCFLRQNGITTQERILKQFSSYKNSEILPVLAFLESEKQIYIGDIYDPVSNQSYVTYSITDIGKYRIITIKREMESRKNVLRLNVITLTIDLITLIATIVFGILALTNQ